MRWSVSMFVILFLLLSNCKKQENNWLYEYAVDLSVGNVVFQDNVRTDAIATGPPFFSCNGSTFTLSADSVVYIYQSQYYSTSSANHLSITIHFPVEKVQLDTIISQQTNVPVFNNEQSFLRGLNTGSVPYFSPTMPGDQRFVAISFFDGNDDWNTSTYSSFNPGADINTDANYMFEVQENSAPSYFDPYTNYPFTGSNVRIKFKANMYNGSGQIKMITGTAQMPFCEYLEL